MRIANLQGRASLVVAHGFVDIAIASDGVFGPDVKDVVAELDRFSNWYVAQEYSEPSADEMAQLESDERLTAVIDSPRQVFAAGLNYRQHAHELGLPNPERPMFFTKYPSCLTGQHAAIPIVSSTTDWEAELVVIIGTGGRSIAVDRALHHVAGFTVGQDISDRGLQMAGAPAQFSLGKSWENFGPIGPWITTLDDIASPHDLAIQSWVSGQLMQDSRTSDMVFSIPELVSYLSKVVHLYPGDIIFTGSPHGVGQGQKPPRFLQVGDTITTTIEGLGTLHNSTKMPNILSGRAGEI